MYDARVILRDTTVRGNERPLDGAPVLLVAGDRHFSSHALAAGSELVFGRDPTCEVCLDHERVSRRHAVVRAGTTCTIEDLGSTNGVRVNGRTMSKGERIELAVGDGFSIGPFHALLLGPPSSAGASVDGRAALVVRDPRPGALSDVVARIAAADASVIIRGETGSGKEVLARALHERSNRGGPFVSINCAAIPEALFESELFGHERGAFTGAAQARPGLLESGDDGTVLLDEIGELPLPQQAKLLRAIEAREVVRVGGTRPIALNLRFLAATHRDLRADVARGTFRQDLYFRLNGVTLHLPPLRERKDAIPDLAQAFLAAVDATKRLSPAAVATLVGHPWPGNVRELRAVIERAALLASGAVLEPRHIDLDAAPEPTPPAAAPVAHGEPRTERDRIIAALEQCAGNQTRAARVLGISRATLVHKLALLEIPRPRR
jgi:two-component system response regulator AtoC